MTATTGIDVQAELQLKTGTSGGAPQPKPAPVPPKPPSTLERAAVNRTSAQRQHQAGIAPKASEPFGIPPNRDGAYGISSPQFQATPSSHVSSPSHTKSPGFGFQGAMSPVGMDPQQAQHQHQQQHQQGRPQLLPQPSNFNQASPPVGMQRPENDPKPGVSMPGGTGPRTARVPSSAYYPSPFQKHYDQLGMSNLTIAMYIFLPLINMSAEQEYDAQADLVEEEQDSVDPSSYMSGFNSTPSGTTGNMSQGVSSFTPQSEASNGAYGNTNNMLGNYEPMLDTDPFGLSASMHFQTPFSYEQNNTRP